MTYATTPGGWITTKLGTVLDFKYGKSLPAKTRDGVGFPVYGSNGVVGFHSAPLIPHAGIVVGRKGSFGEVHLSLQPFSPIDTTYFIDEFGPQIIKFWFYHLKHLPLTQLNRASAIPGLNREDAYGLEVPLPPLAEQREIADRLDTLLAQVDTLKGRLDALPAILKRFRQSVLAAAVSGKLTEEWRANQVTLSQISISEIKDYWFNKYSNKEKYYKVPSLDTKQQQMYDLPETWQWCQLGNIFDVHVGSTPSRKNKDYWGVGVNWVSSSEVAFCRIKETKETITLAGMENSSTKLHPPGTVMLAMIGQGKTRGQPAILDIDACHNQNTAALRVPEAYCVPEYLYYFLYQRYEETRRVGSGNNQQAMNKKIVQSLAFPLPTKREQTEIVRRVDQLFAFAGQVEQRVKEAQGRVNNLTQSILAKAFRGELTAEWREQHPELISGENSASALLARIQAERAAQAPVKRTRKKKVSA
ncbi:restriction endonuclease subunit S [Cobetia sp. 5-25-4-2]|uniref:restriction endonuclease subunit S n=1 Tax=Cobetia sp. 5-25-4-2 TaxID=2737459 RepID=UPI0015969A69|nr:restriction endonuclease subunit S [Cobetia sp. 5-25-4-2]